MRLITRTQIFVLRVRWPQATHYYFLMLKQQFETDNLMSVCTANQPLPVYSYILTTKRLCSGNETLSPVYCIVLIHVHEITRY